MLLLFVACTAAPDDSAAPPAPTCDATGELDATLTVPDVQALGTHNSYHVEPETVLDASHAYTQPTLDAQADLGVRAFEFDVHLASDGEFLVFHLPAIDPETTCPTLAECLGVLRTWSDAHPCHTPFMLWIETKDDIDEAAEGLEPLAGHIADLDAVFRDAWPDRLLTPDDLRGDHATLPEAVADGWPTVAATRGHLITALLDHEAGRTEYLEGAPALEGRALFVDSESADDAFAATFKIDDAPGNAEEVQALVAAGFLVTSNVDGAEDDAATNEASLAAALEAGPQYLASDNVVRQHGSEYVAELPGGSPRCHPDRVPGGCGPEVIEP